jgi:hypothetical protein
MALAPAFDPSRPVVCPRCGWRGAASETGVQPSEVALCPHCRLPVVVAPPAKNDAVITFFCQPARVVCDRQCHKAWGINNRPRVQLSDDPDDYAFLADDELGEAPADPGTYEGGDAKPLSPDEFPQKWCVRECERCAMSQPGEYHLPLVVRSFDQRRYNKLGSALNAAAESAGLPAAPGLWNAVAADIAAVTRIAQEEASDA